MINANHPVNGLVFFYGLCQPFEYVFRFHVSQDSFNRQGMTLFYSKKMDTLAGSPHPARVSLVVH